MACVNKTIGIEKRKDLAHMKIMCVYSSNIVDEPRCIVEINGLYYIEPVARPEYICKTVKIGTEYVIE